MLAFARFLAVGLFTSTLFAGVESKTRWASVAYRVAAEGTVLLKNEASTLPVASTATFRFYSLADLAICGGGSAFVNAERVVTVEDGLRQAGLCKVNPSGCLADTLAEKVSDYPADPYFHAYELALPYAEGLDVGYRYFNRKAKSAIVYPFGFGLSYTRTCRSLCRRGVRGR